MGARQRRDLLPEQVQALICGNCDWTVKHMSKCLRLSAADLSDQHMKNREHKNSFLQRIKMISAVVGAFKRPAAAGAHQGHDSRKNPPKS